MSHFPWLLLSGVAVVPTTTAEQVAGIARWQNLRPHRAAAWVWQEK